MKKILLSFLMVGMFVSSAFAWDIPGQAFGIAPISSHLSIAPPLTPENDFVLMPTTNIGFDVANTANFGLGVSYDFLFANVASSANAGDVAITPYLGVGVFASAIVGDWVSSNGTTPPSAELGFNLIGPTIQGFPELGLELGWQTGTGNQIFLLNANFPLIVVPGLGVIKL